MRTKFVKRNFYIPESYALKSDYINPTTIISSCSSSSNCIGNRRSYSQHTEFPLKSILSVGIHTIDDDYLEISSPNNSLGKSSLLSDKV